MNSFIQDLRFGARILARNPGFTAVAVLVLALAIGGTTAMFTIINSLVFRPIHAKDPDALVRFYGKENKPNGQYRGFSYPNYREIRSRNDACSDVLAFAEAMVGFNQGDLTRRTFSLMISANYFSTLGVSLAAGRPFLPEEERPGAAVPVLIVSHGFWKQNGADPELIGKTVRLNGHPFQVVGIAPPYFTGITAMFAPDFYLPLGMYEALANDFTNEGKRHLEDRRHHCLRLVGRLQPGLTRSTAQARLESLSRRMESEFPEENKDYGIQLGSLSRISMNTYPRQETEPRTMSILLMSMSLAVLLIACLNLANMLLARGAARRREIAVRLAVGSGRLRLVRQLLTESLLLALLGGAGGLVLSIWANQLLIASFASKLPFLTIVFDPRPDWRILATTFGLCLFSVLLFGLGPAWRLSQVSLTQELKEQVGEALHSRNGRSVFAPRNLLVVGQLALSLVLLTAAGLFARGAAAAVRANPGFSFDRGLLVETDASLGGFDETRGRQVYLEILERFRALPGVRSASLAHVIPFGVFSDGRELKRPGSSGEKTGEDKRLYAGFNIVGTDYFKTLGIQVLQGREFDRVEMASRGPSRVAIIDQPLARELFKDEPPVGRHIQFVGSEEHLEIVGLVSSIKDDLSAQAAQPHVYVPFGPEYRSGMNLHVRMAGEGGGTEAALLRVMRETIREAAPNLAVVSIQSFKRFHEEGLMLWFMKTAARVFSLFGGLALFLAVIGIYGVKSYVVARRTREIGIRMALGANARKVLWMILGEGLVLTLSGITLGLLLALGVNFLLRSVVYGVGAFDPVAFTLAPLCLGLTALLACYLPARRATRVQPIAALRYE